MKSVPRDEGISEYLQPDRNVADVVLRCASDHVELGSMIGSCAAVKGGLNQDCGPISFNLPSPL